MNWSKSFDQFKTGKLYLIINHFQDASASAEIYPLLSHLTSQSYQNLALNPWFIGSARLCCPFPLSSSLCLIFTFLGWSRSSAQLTSVQHFQSRCDFCLLLNVIFQSNKPTLLSIIIIKWLVKMYYLILTFSYDISYMVLVAILVLEFWENFYLLQVNWGGNASKYKLEANIEFYIWKQIINWQGRDRESRWYIVQGGVGGRLKYRIIIIVENLKIKHSCW